MKLISAEEAAAIPKRLQNRIHPVRNMLLQLKKGENLMVKKTEWNWKRKTPSAICRKIESQQRGAIKFDCFLAIDETKWIITRTL